MSEKQCNTTQASCGNFKRHVYIEDFGIGALRNNRYKLSHRRKKMLKREKVIFA